MYVVCVTITVKPGQGAAFLNAARRNHEETRKEPGNLRFDVLRAASWGARDWLGFPGLVEGGLADLVVYDTDPRADLRVVQAPRRIILRGRVLR